MNSDINTPVAAPVAIPTPAAIPVAPAPAVATAAPAPAAAPANPFGTKVRKIFGGKKNKPGTPAAKV